MNRLVKSKRMRVTLTAKSLLPLLPQGGEGWGEEAKASDCFNVPVLLAANYPSPQPSPRLGGERELVADSLGRKAIS